MRAQAAVVGVLGRWRLGAIVGAHRAVLGRFRAV